MPVKFEPVTTRVDGTVPMPEPVKVGVGKGNNPNSGRKKGEWHGGGLKQSAERLKLARDVYQFLYSLGEPENEYLRKCGYFNRRGLKTIIRHFRGTYKPTEVESMLRYLSKNKIIYYYSKQNKSLEFFLLTHPIHPELLLVDDE